MALDEKYRADDSTLWGFIVQRNLLGIEGNCMRNKAFRRVFRKEFRDDFRAGCVRRLWRFFLSYLW